MCLFTPLIVILIHHKWLGGKPRVADSSSKHGQFSSACTTNRFPSPRCASATKIVRPLESIPETQPQLHPALLRLSAMIPRRDLLGLWNQRVALPHVLAFVKASRWLSRAANKAVRYFSIACRTSCSLVPLPDSCAIADCPNANDSRATLMTVYGIMRFMCELLSER